MTIESPHDATYLKYMKTREEILKVTLAYWIRVRGIEKGKLAEAVGIRARQISRILKGENYPTSENLDAMAAVLKINVSDLTSDPGVPKAEPISLSSKSIAEYVKSLEKDISSARNEVARVSKQNELELARLKKENDNLKNQIKTLPEDFWAAWPKAELRQRAFSLFFVTLNREHLSGVHTEFVSQVLKTIQLHGLSPERKRPRDK